MSVKTPFLSFSLLLGISPLPEHSKIMTWPTFLLVGSLKSQCVFVKNLMKILARNRLLAQTKYVSFVPRSEIQKLAQNKGPEQKQLWPQPTKDLGTASICFIMRDPTEMSMYLLTIKPTSVVVICFSSLCSGWHVASPGRRCGKIQAGHG